jgi:hypothetical protein
MVSPPETMLTAAAAAAASAVADDVAGAGLPLGAV